MSDTPSRDADAGGYEIRIRGRLPERWSAWFDGLEIVHEADGTTVIRSAGLDQASLHGLLAKVRDLGLPLISVTPTPNAPESTNRSIER